jgi:hypothetical protein
VLDSTVAVAVLVKALVRVMLEYVLALTERESDKVKEYVTAVANEFVKLVSDVMDEPLVIEVLVEELVLQKLELAEL